MSPPTVAEGRDDDTIAPILFVALVIQLARWKRAAETEKGLARVATVHIGTERQTWLEQVSDAEDKRR